MATPATREERLTKALLRLDQIQDELAEGKVNRPDFSDQGRTVAFNAYRQSLLDEKKQLIEVEIPQLQGAWEVWAVPGYYGGYW